jgi:hypothetical protein
MSEIGRDLRFAEAPVSWHLFQCHEVVKVAFLDDQGKPGFGHLLTFTKVR